MFNSKISMSVKSFECELKVNIEINTTYFSPYKAHKYRFDTLAWDSM